LVWVGRQAPAEVDELPDACLVGEVADDAADEGPVIPDDSCHIRHRRDKLLRRLPVDGEIVLAAEQVIINPGDIRPGDINADRRVMHRHMRRHS
jgi:hypothetical protein